GAAMTVVALGVAGIRGPGDDGSRALAQADVTVNTPAAQKERRTFKYVPADAKLVAAASPSELSKIEAVAKLFATADEAAQKKFGLKLSDIDDAQIVKTTATPIADRSGGPQFDRIIIRAARPHDWKNALLGHGDPRAPQLRPKQYRGKEYFVAESRAPSASAAPRRPPAPRTQAGIPQN